MPYPGHRNMSRIRHPCWKPLSSEVACYAMIVNCYTIHCCFCSITKSCPTLCNPMDGSTPGSSSGAFSDSCPLRRWCYLTISSSATLSSFCLQSFPTSESFPMSQLHKQSQSLPWLQFLSLPEGLQIQNSSLALPQIPNPGIKLPTKFLCSNCL